MLEGVPKEMQERIARRLRRGWNGLWANGVSHPDGTGGELKEKREKRTWETLGMHQFIVRN